MEEKTAMGEHLGWCLIPPHILGRRDLSPNQKLLYGRVNGLLGKRGYCYAWNRWLGDQLGLEGDTVSKLLKELQDKNLLIIQIIRDDKNQVIQRRIYTQSPSPITVGEGVPYNGRGGSPITVGEGPLFLKGRGVENNNNNSDSLGTDLEGGGIDIRNRNRNRKAYLAKAEAAEGRETSPIPTQSSGKLPNLNLPQSSNGYITPSQFDDFWKAYPNHNGGRAKAKASWEKACAKKDRPTWKSLRASISAQLRSDQWKDPQFIPRATTWLNQSRWLDDPKDLVSYKKTSNSNGTAAPRNGLCCTEEEAKKYSGKVDQVIYVQ